ncbi:hypothetical protein CGRA01v4_09381 [Colletotrichum graminicola]|nr:hypothetical protein CGRA01v4_09381 [Colletotrichum graminicola]
MKRKSIGGTPVLIGRTARGQLERPIWHLNDAAGNYVQARRGEVIFSG